ncbi:ATP-dependent OLD family endonuclease [Salinisphaera sp. C84B14]|uniref:ATP-dependent nuclease n=1 Tax=Salinisphaera sp. C84B14 TaxID=1304155 RepID=UPI00334094BF
MPDSARIYKLKITRFRGIETLEWTPAPGMNVLIGGGDAGKTTILDALQLLLHPSNHVSVSESDYWQRQHDDEFAIEAIISLPDSTEIGHQRKFAWPWRWNGHEAVIPSADDDGAANSEPVYRIRAIGTADLEMSWEIVQPNEETDSLSAAVRRRIGIVRLTNDTRNDRDLRLVYGSALDRLVADPALRGRVGRRLSEIDLRDEIGDESTAALAALDQTLADEHLPHNLALGLTSSQGLSVGALTGLLATHTDGTLLPLASWGSGTRRMATLQIAKATEAETRITVIDEIERGLEPYRLRNLTRSLLNDGAQGFVTTHSAVTITAMTGAHLWYLDSGGQIGEIDGAEIARQQQRDPETFLAKLTVICEGVTEIGFLSVLLERAIAGDYRDYGIHLADGHGNSSTLALLKSLSSAGLRFGGFADDEGYAQGQWADLKANMGEQLFRWPHGCTEEAVIATIGDEQLHSLLCDEDGDFIGDRMRTLATRIGSESKAIDDIETSCARSDLKLRQLIVEAATGTVRETADRSERKEWKAHAKHWFKSELGGRELACHMFEFGVWPALRDILLPHINAIRVAVDLPTIDDINYG